MGLVRVEVGQIWKRRNGSTFEIDRVRGDYVRYWIATGSKPQFRYIRIDQLTKRYELVVE